MDEQYVDWGKIPEGYDWVAVDSGVNAGVRTVSEGPIVGMYTAEPTICFNSCWNSPDGNWDDRWVAPNVVIGPLPPWRESLRQRPKK